MEYQPTRIQTESVITKAAEELRRFIEARDLGPGDALPPETQLSTMLGISRNSVREALRVLDGLGFIEKRPGRGAVVRSRVRALAGRPPGRDAVVEGIPVAYEARRLIEQRCAELAAERATEADRAELQGQLARFEEALKRLDFTAAAVAHVDFHEALVRVAGNPILASMFESVRIHDRGVHRVGAGSVQGPPVALAAPGNLPGHRAGGPDRGREGGRRHFQANRPRLEVNIRTRGGPRPAGPPR